MGSLIALAAAAKAPAQVARAALVCTAVPMAVSDVLLNAATNDEQQAFEMIANWSHSGVNHRPGAPGPGFSIYMQSIRLMQRQAAGVLLTDFSACNRFENGLQAADQVSCPVLILSGRKDMMTPPRAAQALFDRLAASSKCPPPERKLLDGGHQVMAEQPDAVLNALREFLSRPA